MRDYGLVANQINQLASQIGGMRRDRAADQARIADTQLKEAQFGLSAQSMKGSQDLEMAKLKRAEYMDGEVSLKSFIDERPWSPEMKKRAFGFIESQDMGDVADVPMFKRGAIYQALQGMADNKRKMDAVKKKSDIESDRWNKEYGLKQQELGIKRQEASAKVAGARDNRSTMEKEVAFISETTNKPMEEALNEWMSNKTLAQRMKIFSDDVKTLNDDISLMGKEGSAKKAKRIEELRSLYRVAGGDMPGSSPMAGNGLPDASQHEGKTIVNDKTGERLKSVNGKWEPYTQEAQQPQSFAPETRQERQPERTIINEPPLGNTSISGKKKSGNQFIDNLAGHKIESPIIKNDGSVWAYVDGVAKRIAIKPSEKIYNNQYDNPRYAEYAELLKSLGI